MRLSPSIKRYIKHNFLILLLLCVPIFIIIFSYFRIQYLSSNIPAPHTPCIPTFTDGDGPYYYANAPTRNKIVPDKNNGEKLIIEGKVLKNDCKTIIPNAILDIWQADEKGEYQKDWYRGKVRVDADGNYKFETVIPKGYGEGTAHRPPHIHFKVVVDNRVVITSEMFFPGVSGRPGFDDAYIMRLEEKNVWGKKVFYGYHDIILPL